MRSPTVFAMQRSVRFSIAAAVAVAALVIAFVPSAANASEPGTSDSIDPTLEQCLVDLHNAERTSRGLNALVVDPGLTDFAREWSLEMEGSGWFRHSDLSVPGTWFGVAENIGWTQGYAYGCTTINDMFVNSPGHLANILGASYDRVGIGITYDPAQGGTVWVTVVFGDSDGLTGPAPGSADPPPAPDFPPTPCISGHCDGFTAVDSSSRWSVFDVIGDQDPQTFYFGDPGDVPFMGDWDGDGVATPGLYRQSDGYVYLRSSNTQGTANYEFFFGDPGDYPLVGDWNGDGKDTVSIYRQSEGRIYVNNTLGTNGGGLGTADYSFGFGNPGDRPFSGDFDGDGIDSVGLYRQSTGFVYFRNSLTTGTAESSFFYGDPGDQIISGDWDGDGDDSVAVYRPSNDSFYVNLENSNGGADWDAYVGAYTYVVSGG